MRDKSNIGELDRDHRNACVSVIVTTLRRPAIVPRAVSSVLSQSYENFELIVIIDGPDEATRQSLAAFSDPRMRVLALEQNVGIAKVRNIGISEAKGHWIAFLDDDDEWLSNKLEVQVAAAEALGGERVLLTAQYIERGTTRERIMPYRSPLADESLAEFIFCRKGFFSRAGGVQTSTYFVSRLLAQEVLFRAEVRSQEDLDWLMRASLKTDRPFHMVAKPLSIYHNQQIVGREGAVADFDHLWNYAHKNRALFTPKAFSFYLATCCAPSVRLAPKPMQRWSQVYSGMRTGKMTLRTLAFAAIYAAFPIEVRRGIRHFINSNFVSLSGRVSGRR